MPRRTNFFPAFAGLVIAAVLILAGVFLSLGNSAIKSDVSNTLAAQKVYFPPADNPQISHLPPVVSAPMAKYAGQLMTTGPQAQAYANFMSVQIDAIGGGLSYSELAAKAVANPKKAKVLEILASSVFRSETIRSEYLNASSFWQTGQIMQVIAYVAYVVAAVMLLISLIALVRQRRARFEMDIEPALVVVPVVETV